jgi:hypothetical protein
MNTKSLTIEEIDFILEQNPEPKDVSFLQIKIQEKCANDWRSFLSFYSKETDVIYRLRGYGSTPGEAADDAWEKFNDEELRWNEIDSYERWEQLK